MRDAVPDVVEDYEGAATIETYTIFYRRDGSIRFGTVIGRTSGGARVLARVAADDAFTLTALRNPDVEAVGLSGVVSRNAEGLLHWRVL